MTKYMTLVVAGAICASAQLFNPAGPFAGVPAGASVRQMVVGDVNGDGRTDVVTANSNGTLSVLYNVSGTDLASAPGSPILAGAGLARIALADLNLDGSLDILAAFPSSVVLFTGGGPRIFSSSVTATTGSSNSDIAVADFNRDGIPDAAIADSAGAVRIWQGRTAGQPTISLAGNVAGANAVVAADFNGDRKVDLAVSSATNEGVSIFLGNGDFTFTANGSAAAASLGTAANLRAADFNGDGKIDVARRVGPHLLVLPGNGSGGLSAAIQSGLPGGSSHGDFDVADFNLDGRLDCVAGSSELIAMGMLGLRVRVNGNDGTGYFSITGLANSLPGAGPPIVAGGDFNNDGKVDFAAASEDQLYVFLSRGGNARVFSLEFWTAAGSSTILERAFTEALSFFTSNRPWLSGRSGCGGSCISANPAGLTTGRYEGAVFHGFTEAITTASLQVSRASGGFTYRSFATGTGSREIVAGDFNGDGKPDLAVTAEDSRVTVLLGGTAGFSPAPGSPFQRYFSGPAAGSGDFNGDGRTDLVFVGNLNTVDVWLGAASGGFAVLTDVSAGGVNPLSLAVADFNRDGKLDIASVNQSQEVVRQNGSVAILLGTGSGTFAPGKTQALGIDGATDSVAADFDRDGKPDLAIATFQGVKLLLGNGAGGFTAGTAASSAAANGVAAGDWNADGMTDLAVAQGAQAGIYLGNGAGLFSAAAGSPIALQTEANRIAKGDFDGDGNPDLILSLSSGNPVVLLGNGAGGFTPAPAAFFGVGNRGLAVADFNGDGFTDFAIAAGSYVNVASGGVQDTGVRLSYDQPSAIASGQNVRLTAAVTGAPSAEILSWPRGAVEFYDGATKLGQAPPVNGLAAFDFVKPSIGVHSSLTAKYLGSPVFNPSTSAPVTLTVVPQTPVLPPPAIVSPANGSTLTGTVVTFQWTAVAGASRYELRLIEANTPQQFRVSLLPSNTSAVYTFPGGNYGMELLACSDTACGPPAVSHFVVQGGGAPTVPVAGLSCFVVNDASRNRLECKWDPVPRTDFYFFNVVQPGAGPGGGALTVAGGQVAATSKSAFIPNGNASVVVRACTGDGCGPFSAAFGLAPAFGNADVPILGTPFNGESVNSGNLAPKVEFSWNRVAGDTGSNFTYRLYVQDFSRNRAALDILTTNNFYAAFFNPGTRYDALVIAIPTGGGAQRQGPPSPFLVRGKVPNAPVATEPTYGSAVDRDAQGKIHVAWTPIVNQDGTVATRNYQYFFNTPTPVTGVTTNIALDEVFPTGTFIGIIRACTTGITCVAGSETGWGPYSNAAGSEGGQALFTVR